MNIFLGILIPFLGTSIGALMVFFMRSSLNKKVEKLLLTLIKMKIVIKDL